MDKAEITMRENILKNTGKSFEEWIGIVRAENFAKHGEIMKFLKEEHGFTHGFANYVALKSREADAGSAASGDDLIAKQYAGKEHWKPFYDGLISEVSKFGSDVEISPKNAYVSLRRKKQFGTLQPASKTRFEVGFNLKGQAAEGALEEIKTANAMCSHKISAASPESDSSEIIRWLRSAYDRAG